MSTRLIRSCQVCNFVRQSEIVTVTSCRLVNGQVEYRSRKSSQSALPRQRATSDHAVVAGSVDYFFAFFAVDFLAGVFLGAAFLAGVAFLAAAFLGAAFLAGVAFLAAAFLGAAFFAGVAFLAAAFLAGVAFLAAAFFAGVFLVAVFFTGAFLAGVFACTGMRGVE